MHLIALPHPRELPVLIKPDGEIEQYRNLFCGHYDACLDEAIDHAWTSWTCAGCEYFAMLPAVRAGARTEAAPLVVE